MVEASIRLPVRLIAYSLMPNHFHLVLRPLADGDPSRRMHWLLTTHVRRYLRHDQHGGHVWQGRFKAFPIQDDEPLATVVRYVERNGLRAGLAERAEGRPWLSPANPDQGPRLDGEALRREADWIELVNTPATDDEDETIRHSIVRDRPHGSDPWTVRTSARLRLDDRLRPRGRPSKQEPAN